MAHGVANDKEDALTKFEERFAAAVALHRSGRLAEAKRAYEALIEAAPDRAEPYNNLGLIVEREGAPLLADSLYKKAVALDRGNVDALNNLGNLYKGAGQFAEAVMYFEAALSIAPFYVAARVNLAGTLQAGGDLAGAARHYQAALETDPTVAELHNGFGHLLLETGDQPRATRHFILATLLRPDWAGAWNNLGTAWRRNGRLDGAERSLLRALTLDPDAADTLLNLGNAMSSLGRVEEAVAFYERILAQAPLHRAAISNLLFALNYADDLSAAGIGERHKALGGRLDEAAGRPPRPPRREPGGRLRIGYVSPDLRTHSVAYFFEPLLRAHDRSNFEIFCYADLFAPDAVSERLAALADRWVPTLGLDDAALAARIAADGIDILVDLAGHSAHNRLGVFARRPAPLQATWLGYPNTTGLSAIDLRLVDEITDPFPEADALASERLIRLEGGFHCYDAPPDAPEITPPPRDDRGFVTFGSFNNIAKLSDRTLAAWGAILDRVERSRLLLKSRFFGDESTRAAMVRRLNRAGIDERRVLLLDGIAEVKDHLGAYAEIDITLDSFPYNGTTTLCESLWMGVPVVTLLGDSHLSRVGASLLTHIGLPEMIGATVEDYVEKAAALAASDELRPLRAGLRTRMAASPICDAAGFARKMEQALRDAWLG